MNNIIEKLNSSYPFFETLNTGNLLPYIIFVIAGYLFVIRGGTIISLMIIKLPYEKMKNSPKQEKLKQDIYNDNQVAATLDVDNSVNQSAAIELEDKKRYGKTIGEIERVIIVSGILFNIFELVAIVTAVKSIGRFKELDSKTSDYYIVGTFASFSIAFLIGLLLTLFKKLLLG